MDNSDNIYPREYDFYDLMVVAGSFYVKNYVNIFKIAFISYFIINLLIILLPDVDIKGLFSYTGKDAGYLSFYMTSIFFLTSLSNVPIVSYTINKLNKNDIEVLGSFNFASKRIIENLIVNIGTIALFFVSLFFWMFFSIKFPSLFLVTIIPVIVILLFFSFSVLAFVTRNVNLWMSFGYSFRVVNGRWLRIFLYSIIIYALSAITSMAVSIPYTFFSRTLFSELIFNTIVNVLCSYFVILMTFLFINLDDTKTV